MRRKDREMGRDFALAVADSCPYMVMSVVLPDGSPYCVPLSMARVGDCLYFHAAPEGQKLEALREDPRVCIACVGDVRPAQDKFTTEYASAIITGTAQRVEEDGEKTEALRAICLRYTPSNMAAFDAAIAMSLARTELWKIHMESVTGKRKKYDKQGKEMKYGRMEE